MLCHVDYLKQQDNTPRSGHDLIVFIHSQGINCRHLGLVRQKTVNPLTRIYLMTEIVARTMKNEV